MFDHTSVISDLLKQRSTRTNKKDFLGKNIKGHHEQQIMSMRDGAFKLEDNAHGHYLNFTVDTNKI